MNAVKLEHLDTMVKIKTFRQTQWWGRAQFMKQDGLIAILEKGLFWGGLKPPLTPFIFQENTNEEEDGDV